MQLSDFTFRLILVFLPGIIAFIIIDNLTIHKETKIHHWFVYPLLLGFLSYLPWYIIVKGVQLTYGVNLPFQFIASITDTKAQVNFSEVIIASLMAVIWGFLITKAITERYLFRFASKFNISKKFPEIDAWDNFNNIFDPEWITVRDLEKGLSFQGRLISSSDATDRDGIVLTDVKVHDAYGDFLYYVPVIYIPRKMDNLLVEIPQ